MEQTKHARIRFESTAFIVSMATIKPNSHLVRVGHRGAFIIRFP